MSFSSLKRAAYFKTLASEQFDVLVVGGGITGAGIALDAAVRGLKVALVEKRDFASGTSSRSTKLIHGGLRYLKQLEVKLVREVGLERAIVYRNAPHVVIPEKMLLPIVKGGSLGKYSSSLGLFVYDRLAQVEKDERREMLTKEETIKKEPLLREDILVGGGCYIEYRSDDARLVIEIMKEAVSRGAIALNYTSFVNATHAKDRINGAVVKDELTGKEYTVKAKTIINACGPWVDTLRKQEGSLEGKHLLLTKGVHIVVDQSKMPIKTSVYFDVPTDSRMIFAIPRNGKVYIGTTDTFYADHENVEYPYTNLADAEYVLAAANFMFPSLNLTLADIESSWAGLRPLIHEEGKSPSEVSRKDEIFVTKTKLISIAGGKLTGYRKMAERAVDVAMEQLKELEGRKSVKCTTKKVALSGGDLKGEKGVKQYIDYLTAQYPKISKAEIANLVYKYGSNSNQILEEAAKYSGEYALLLTELDYCIENEAVFALSDFLIRRTGMLFFDRPILENAIPILQSHLAEKCGYNGTQSETLLEEFMNEYEGVIAFKQKEK
jgi:glycerol-3-phosphate dehydrogenase